MLPRPEGLRWAAAAELAFALPRGRYLGPLDGDSEPDPGSGAPARPTAALLAKVSTTGRVPAIGPADRARAAEDLAYWRAGVVVLDPAAQHAGRLLETVTALLGPPDRVQDVWLWRL
jgi:hypothetical protein